jgi:Uma2 family endonuclease
MKIVLDDQIRAIDFPDQAPWSEAQFFDFCMANKDLNLERDKDGNILIMSPVFLQGGMFESRVNFELALWNEKTGLGYTFSSQSGFTLPNKAVRSPDASWVTKEHIEALPEGELQKFGRICPDFVVEIRSKTDRLQPLHEKMQEYIENGCRLGFLIDPYERQAWIYRPQVDAEIITDFTGSLSGEAVLPDFALQLSIFNL